MEIKLGNLDIKQATEHPELMGKPVSEFLSMLPDVSGVGVAEIDANFSDTANFCGKYKITPEQAANCVIVETKGGDRKLVALVVLSSTRADVNGAVCDALGVRKASFAQMDRAVSESGMEYGAITPIGLPSNWTILIDKAIADSSYVVIGSGIRGSKLIVPGSFLASLPNAQVVEGLAKSRIN